MYVVIPLILALTLFLFPRGPKIHSGDVEGRTADDLDLHCIGPDGVMINFDNKTSPSGGHLDVDMNVGGGRDGRKAVEHIYWPKGRAPKGNYKVLVHLYQRYSSNLKSSLRLQ